MPLPDQEPFKLSKGPAAACCAWPDAADNSTTAADITATAKVRPTDRATDPAGADLRARRPVLNHSSIRMSSPLHCKSGRSGEHADWHARTARCYDYQIPARHTSTTT